MTKLYVVFNYIDKKFKRKRIVKEKRIKHETITYLYMSYMDIFIVSKKTYELLLK